MSILYNPTDTVIAPKYDNGVFKFLPGQELEVFNNYAARHILNRMAKHGLVELKYGAEEAREFGDYELYRQAKAVEGLEALLNTIDEQIKLFEIYLLESERKPSTERNYQQKNLENVKMRRAQVAAILEKVRVTPPVTPADRIAARKEKIAALQMEITALEKSNGDNAAKSA